ncbi:hypothetical protein AWB78_06533 [Caballeronia calidae]|uniref:Uncharacterized protein n=1 Tax=Caballeronia calidae TaxID=1777139 RepID=A0A158E8L0_9BURK|nr:hypothetical protein AWB78_06533 [Caballeronia calidae]
MPVIAPVFAVFLLATRVSKNRRTAANKTISVVFTDEGLRESERLFRKHFTVPDKTDKECNELLTRHN